MTDEPQIPRKSGGYGNHRIDTPHPAEMHLRPARPSVTRLSRKVLLGLGIVAAAGVATALFFALEPHRSTTGSELYNTGNRTTPDGLANLPRDYTGLPRGVPQLGPPLPGDLGRPILNAREHLRPVCRHLPAHRTLRNNTSRKNKKPCRRGAHQSPFATTSTSELGC